MGPTSAANARSSCSSTWRSAVPASLLRSARTPKWSPNGVDGFLPDSDDAWEEALTVLIEDPALRQEMGARARARVEGAYSLAVVADRYKALIESLAR